MPIDITCIDNKFKKKRTRILTKQREFDVMEKRASRDAMERFKEEPYQLRCQRMREKQDE